MNKAINNAEMSILIYGRRDRVSLKDADSKFWLPTT